MMAKQSWKKSADVPTAFYEREDGGYMADCVRPAPGIVLGPLGVSNGTYGWRVVHTATGLLVHRGVSFRTRAQAKRYAEGMLLIPGAVTLLTEHAMPDGKFSPGHNPETVQALGRYSTEWNPDSKRWNE